MRTVFLLITVPVLATLIVSCGGDSPLPDRSPTGSRTPVETPSLTDSPVATPSDDSDIATPTVIPTPPSLLEPPAGFVPAASRNVDSQCTPEQTVVADFAWQPAEPAGEQQIDLSLGVETFVPGGYVTSQTLPEDAASLRWTDLTPSALYFWRIRTSLNDHWVAGDTGRFETPNCFPADQRTE